MLSQNETTTRRKLLSTCAAAIGIAGMTGAMITGTGAASASGIDDYTPVDNPADYGGGLDHYGWAFFQTPDGRMCGIAPNGGQSGCDAVPYNAAPDLNQTVVSSWAAASMIHSDEPTFTLPGGQRVLPEGFKLENWGTECGVGYQGTVTCQINQHSFVLSTTYVVLQ